MPEMVPGDKNNFLEINATELSFVASQSVLIGGQRRQVKEIMFYKPSWIKNHYTDPMASLKSGTIDCEFKECDRIYCRQEVN